MGLVVLGAVGGKLVLLLIDKHSVALLIVVDLEIQPMNVALHFGDVRLGGHNSSLTFISLGGPHSQLLVETGGPIDKGGTLLLEDLDT